MDPELLMQAHTSSDAVLQDINARLESLSAVHTRLLDQARRSERGRHAFKPDAGDRGALGGGMGSTIMSLPHRPIPAREFFSRPNAVSGYGASSAARDAYDFGGQGSSGYAAHPTSGATDAPSTAAAVRRRAQAQVAGELLSAPSKTHDGVFNEDPQDHGRRYHGVDVGNEQNQNSGNQGPAYDGGLGAGDDWTVESNRYRDAEGAANYPRSTTQQQNYPRSTTQQQQHEWWDAKEPADSARGSPRGYGADDDSLGHWREEHWERKAGRTGGRAEEDDGFGVQSPVKKSSDGKSDRGMVYDSGHWSGRRPLAEHKVFPTYQHQQHNMDEGTADHWKDDSHFRSSLRSPRSFHNEQDPCLVDVCVTFDNEND